MIRVLPACVFRRFVPRESICGHEDNAARVVTLNECSTCPLVGLVATPEATRTTVEPAVTTETLRSGHVVRTVPCKGCAGNVRIKVG